MSDFIDDLARALATPMPRRSAVRGIAKALAGAALLGFTRRAQAASCSSCCAPAKNCESGQTCCTPGITGNGAICAQSPNFCCGSANCSPGQGCCTGTNGSKYCINAGQFCCGNSYCNAGTACCTNSSGTTFCSPSGGFCCGNVGCNAGQQCCTGTNGTKFCANAGQECCGNVACATNCCNSSTKTCCATCPCK